MTLCLFDTMEIGRKARCRKAACQRGNACVKYDAKPFENMAGEEWRAIPGFDGRYEASTAGRIRSLWCRKNAVDPHLIEPWLDNGRRKVSVYLANGVRQQLKVARLVLLAFKGEPAPGTEASHLNGNRADDRPDNLVWESRRKNNHRKKEHGTEISGERRHSAKLTDAQVREIRATKGQTVARIVGRKYGVCENTVTAIWRGDTRRNSL